MITISKIGTWNILDGLKRFMVKFEEEFNFEGRSY